MRGRRPFSIAVLVIVAACSGGDEASDTSEATVPLGTAASTSAATASAATTTSEPSASSTTPVDTTTPPDTTTSVATTEPEIASGDGILDLAITAPRFAIDDLDVTLRAVAVDELAEDTDVVDRFCSDSSLPPENGGNQLFCESLPPGTYELDIDLAAFGATVVTPTIWCFGPAGETTSFVIEVVPGEFTSCGVTAAPRGLLVEIPFGAESTWLPTIVDPDGERFDLDNCTLPDPPTPGGGDYLECWDIAAGDYELPDQPITTDDLDRPFTCLPGFGLGNGPGYDRFARVSDGLDEFGGTLAVWTCWQETPIDRRERSISISVFGNPSDAEALQIQILQNGIDVFPERCDRTGSFTPWDGVTYQCEGVERANADVIAPPVEGARTAVRCDPALEYPENYQAYIDLETSEVAFCSAIIIRPTLAFALDIGSASPDDVVDGLVIDGPTGRFVADACERFVEDDPTFATVWLYCSPLPYGTYTVPDQPVVEGGPDESFLCNEGTGIGAGPETTNTAVLAFGPFPDGIWTDVWTCNLGGF